VRDPDKEHGIYLACAVDSRSDPIVSNDLSSFSLGDEYEGSRLIDSRRRRDELLCMDLPET